MLVCEERVLKFEQKVEQRKAACFFFVCFLLTADRVLLWTLKFVNVITQERSDVGVSNATGA